MGNRTVNTGTEM